MRWFQSFPWPAPENRSFVAWRPGAVERIVVEHGAYGEAIRRMYQASGSGFFMIEWDIALGLDQVAAMEAAARWRPEYIHVGNYALHHQAEPPRVQWNQPVAKTEQASREWRSKDILDCDQPGLGLIWFPVWVLELMEAENRWQALRYPNADATFWNWVGKDKMHVVEDVRPVHLHW